MTATVGIQHAPGGTLTVHGISTDNTPYAIEITNVHRAYQWAKVLSYRKYARNTMGPQVRRPSRAKKKSGCYDSY